MKQKRITDKYVEISRGTIVSSPINEKDIWVEFTTSIGCINNCLFCPQTLFVKRYFDLFGRNAPRMLTYTNFCRILKKIPKRCTVVFSGESEPFQNPRCTDMVLTAHRAGHPVIICTTLVGLSTANISKILKTVSFQGKEPKFFVHIPSQGKLENIKVTHEYLQTLNYLLTSRIPIDFHYHGKIPCVQVARPIRQAGYKLTRLQLISRANNINGGNISNVRRKRGKLDCHVIRMKRHVVLPNGAVILCCMDFGLQHVLGNILSSSFSSIHKGKEWKRILLGLQDERIDTLCRHCHWAANADIIAKCYNTSFSVKKIPLRMKIILYNHFRPLYFFTRSIYRKLHALPDTNNGREKCLGHSNSKNKHED